MKSKTYIKGKFYLHSIEIKKPYKRDRKLFIYDGDIILMVITTLKDFKVMELSFMGVRSLVIKTNADFRRIKPNFRGGSER